MSYSNQRNINQHEPTAANVTEEAPVAINGFQQILEMLRVADPAFRESLLRRLAQRDRNLASSLRRDLAL